MKASKYTLFTFATQGMIVKFKSYLLMSVLSYIPLTTYAITPEFEDIIFSSRAFCSDNNPICSCSGNNLIDANDDGTIDIIFNQFQATSMNGSEELSFCTMKIPLKIPPGYRVSFMSLGVEGTTQLANQGAATVMITQSVTDGFPPVPSNIVHNRKNFYYDHGQVQDVVLSTEGDADYTECGKELVFLNAEIELIVKGSETIVNIDEGAAGVRFTLDYQRC